MQPTTLCTPQRLGDRERQKQMNCVWERVRWTVDKDIFGKNYWPVRRIEVKQFGKCSSHSRCMALTDRGRRQEASREGGVIHTYIEKNWLKWFLAVEQPFATICQGLHEDFVFVSLPEWRLSLTVGPAKHHRDQFARELHRGMRD